MKDDTETPELRQLRLRAKLLRHTLTGDFQEDPETKADLQKELREIEHKRTAAKGPQERMQSYSTAVASRKANLKVLERQIEKQEEVVQEAADKLERKKESRQTALGTLQHVQGLLAEAEREVGVHPDYRRLL